MTDEIDEKPDEHKVYVVPVNITEEEIKLVEIILKMVYMCRMLPPQILSRVAKILDKLHKVNVDGDLN